MQQKEKAGIPASASVKCAPLEEQNRSTLKGEAGLHSSDGEEGKTVMRER